MLKAKNIAHTTYGKTSMKIHKMVSVANHEPIATQLIDLIGFSIEFRINLLGSFTLFNI